MRGYAQRKRCGVSDWVRAHTRTHLHTHIHTCTHMHTHMYTCTHTRAHTHTHTTRTCPGAGQRSDVARICSSARASRASPGAGRQTCSGPQTACLPAMQTNESRSGAGRGENNGITASTTAASAIEASAIEASITVGGKETKHTHTHTHTQSNSKVKQSKTHRADSACSEFSFSPRLWRREHEGERENQRTQT